ncbi:MAG: hypothetical protein IPI79_06950 [Moraxellaceae bacterium]|nr:hypothetical protein [Moraxellaceae bacterium]
MSKVADSISAILSVVESDLKYDMDNALEDFQEKFKSILEKEAKQIINATNDRLKKTGLSLFLNIPDIQEIPLDFSDTQMLTDLVDEGVMDIPKTRRKQGLWGRMCGFFKTNQWGWESYTEKQAYINVDINKVKEFVNSSLSEVFGKLEKSLKLYVNQPLEGNIHDFFQILKETIEQIKGDLLQSIKDKKCSKEEQQLLLKNIASLRRSLPNVLSDGKALKSDIRPLVQTLSGAG